MPPVRLNNSRTAAQAAALLLVISAAAAGHVVVSASEKSPMHTSILRGEDWIKELLTGNDSRFYNQMGVQKHVFRRLIEELRQKTSLDNTKHVSVEEQVAIFLHVAITGQSNRKLQERFQRSGDTISRCIQCLITMSSDLIRLFIEGSFIAF
jgi:hypothetical protein